MPLVVPLVPETAAQSVTVRAPIRHLCPFKEEVDDGHITVVFRVCTSTFEMHALADYLGSFAAERISHESLTDRIYTELSQQHGPVVERVSTEWETAGAQVLVTRA
jgi:NADPH-dependent 7-cyano-7-deazaguanine reductase QueF